MIALPLCVFKYDDLVIPPNTGLWRNELNRFHVVTISGIGTFKGFGMHCTWHGISFGFQIDGSTFVNIHNGACVSGMGLIGAAGAGMPCWCPYYLNDKDLSVAYKNSFKFYKSLTLCLSNSHPEEQRVNALHLYFNADPKQIKVSTDYLLTSWTQ